jgi:hypothetical protein
VFCKAVVYFLVALPSFPQTQTFITIAIEHVPSTDRRDGRIEVRPNGDLFARAVPVAQLLRYAYDLPANPSERISTLAEWTSSEKYDVEARPLSTPSLLVFRTPKSAPEFDKWFADYLPIVSGS